MRIINQDKTKSIEFENYDISVDGKYIISVGVSKMILGQYKTENRARGVFDEIHEAYTAMTPIYIMPIS
jgi:hypothetical protein